MGRYVTRHDKVLHNVTVGLHDFNTHIGRFLRAVESLTLLKAILIGARIIVCFSAYLSVDHLHIGVVLDIAGADSLAFVDVQTT
jgi:hypothetical protein